MMWMQGWGGWQTWESASTHKIDLDLLEAYAKYLKLRLGEPV